MMSTYSVRSRPARYALGVAASGAPLPVVLPLADILPLPDPLFIGAIVGVAWLAGLGPAVTATAGSVVVLDYCFVNPIHTLALHDLPWVGMFCVVSLVLAKVAADHRRIIREREQLLRDEQRARREAESANKAKDQFLAMISHELRTPLATILSWVRILRSDAGNGAPRALEVIERNARAQARLVDDLLEASRAVTGKLSLDLQKVSLSAIVEAALENIAELASCKHLRLTKIINPVHELRGDPLRLQQVVTNLVVNAVKFTPEGGSIQVRLEQDGSSARILVRDTGVGIAPEILPHIFDRFVQGDIESTKRGGLGLGLTIVRHIVELHGGTVHAASEGHGKGATFLVRLPTDSPVAAEPQ